MKRATRQIVLGKSLKPYLRRSGGGATTSRSYNFFSKRKKSPALSTGAATRFSECHIGECPQLLCTAVHICHEPGGCPISGHFTIRSDKWVNDVLLVLAPHCTRARTCTRTRTRTRTCTRTRTRTRQDLAHIRTHAHTRTYRGYDSVPIQIIISQIHTTA